MLAAAALKEIHVKVLRSHLPKLPFRFLPKVIVGQSKDTCTAAPCAILSQFMEGRPPILAILYFTYPLPSSKFLESLFYAMCLKEWGKRHGWACHRLKSKTIVSQLLEMLEVPVFFRIAVCWF